MIEIKKIVIQGYKSYSNRVEFEIASNGLWHILGSNGTGKTNLIESIGWCLTGKTFKGLRVDQVVNWHHKKNGTEVTLYLIINGSEIKISRYRKHPKHKNDVLIFKGWNEEQKIESEVPQKIIDDFIGLTWEELLASVIYSAEDFKSFIEQTPKDRLTFLEHIFQLDKFDTAHELAVNERKNLKDDVSKKEEKIKSAQTIFTSISSTFENLKKSYQDWEDGRKNKLVSLTNEIKELEKYDLDKITEQWKQFDSIRNELKEKENTKSSLNNQINKLNIEISKKKNDHEGKIKNISNDINSLLNKEKSIELECNNEVSKLELSRGRKENELSSLKQNTEQLFKNKEELSSRLKSLENGLEVCPMCDQNIPPEKAKSQIISIKNQIDDVNVKIKSSGDKLTDAVWQIKQIDNSINEFKNKDNSESKLKIREKINEKTEELKKLRDIPFDSNSEQSQINDITTNINETTTRCQEIQSYLNNFVKPEITIDQVYNINAKKQKLNDSIEELKKSENPHKKSIETTYKTVKESENKIEESKKEYEGAANKLRHVEYIADLFKSEIKSSIMTNVVPTFNINLANYINSLMPACELLFDNFMNQTLKFETIDVENPKSLSTGQRARINFAVCLAVYETLKQIRGTVFNAVFFDEVLDFGLDSMGQQIVFDLLKDLNQTVYIVSHRDSSNSDFDGTIRIDRDEKSNITIS